MQKPEIINSISYLDQGQRDGLTACLFARLNPSLSVTRPDSISEGTEHENTFVNPVDLVQVLP